MLAPLYEKVNEQLDKSYRSLFLIIQAGRDNMPRNKISVGTLIQFV